MTALVSRRQLPSDAQASAYFPTKPGQRSKRSSEGQPRSDVVPLNFPATKDILWDRTRKGDPTVLHLTKYRNISLHVLEKSVQLAHRHALQSDGRPYRCFLIGSVISDKDEEGVTITVDRFDPGRDVPGRSGRMPTARLPGDHVIPLTMSVNEEATATTHSTDDFTAAFKLVEHNCSSRDALDVGGILSFRIHCCCYDSADDVTFNLHVGAVTMGTVLEATPINPLPIIPTALARNLTGPLNLSEIQGAPKGGYITMDQTRKLLLLLESDPKAYTLPLIGIWLSGLSNICSPYVWTSCLRYMFNSSINERVCSGDQGFLLVMFSPTSRQPTFYECRSLNGDKPSFELVGCRENIHFYKHMDQTSRTPVHLELTPARDGPNKAAFMEAARQFTPKCSQAKQSKPCPKPAPLPRPTTIATADEDVHMPRPSPKPLIDKSPTVKPSVPELSLIFDSFIEDQQESDQPPHPLASTDHPAPFGEVNSNPDIPDDRRRHRPQQRGPVQNAQENHPFGMGQNGRGGFVGRGMKAGHVDTPTGRPGPLKPVNTNLAHGGDKSRRSIPNNSQGNTKQSQSGMKPKRTPSPAQNGRIQQPLVKTRAPVQAQVQQTSRTPRSDSTPRQKPPRPTSRRSEVMQQTLPLTVGGHQSSPSHEQGCAAPRRMSYPMPASSSRTSQHGAGGQIPHPRPGQSNQAAHPTAQRRSDLQHPPPQQAWGPSQDQSPGPLHHQVVFHDANRSNNPSGNRHPLRDSKASPILATSSGNTASHPVPRTQKASSSTSGSSANSRGSPGSPNATPNCVANASNSASYVGHNTQGAFSMQHPHQVTSPHSLSHTGSPPTLTGFPQAPHGVREASGFHSNQVQSSPANLTGPHPSSLNGSLPHEIPHRQPHSPCHAEECTGRKGVPSEPLPPSGTTPEVPQQPLVSNGQHQDQSRGGRGSDSNDTMAQLRRQEQLIQQLQAQIQMLMQAQTAQSNPPIPSGLVTPPATPTSEETNRLHLSTPVSRPLHSPHHNQAPPVSSGTGQQVVTPISQSSVAPTTHSVSTGTGGDTPPPKTTCSMAVMTGKSLLWPDGTGPPVKTSVSASTSMTPRSSPDRGSKSASNGHATLDTEATLDPESDPEMTLPMQQTRDDTQSTVFDVSAVDLRSFTEDGSPRQTSSPNRSPKWTSGREGNTPQTTHPGTTQGTYPMDSLHSPVLGESASTCAPPGRGWGHPRGNDTEDGSDSDDGGSSEDGRTESERETSESDEERPTRSADPPVSLLYRDERRFYQNLLGRVEQMLTEQAQGGEDGNHGNAMTTQEELRQMGLPTAVDHSVMYRSMCMVNSDFFPRINYVSLMDVHLDSPNLSYEANAIAMKYLTEDELTQLSAGFKGQQTPQPKVNPLLRTALTGLGDIGTGAGPSAVDLSMASRKYMEKYGLLDMPVRKPDRARALGFDETPAQRIVAKNTPAEGRAVRNMKDVAKKHRKTQKPKTTGLSNVPVVSEEVTDQAQTLPRASDDRNKRKVRASPKQHLTKGSDARPGEKLSTENSPRQEPPRSGPISTSPPRPPGQNNEETRTPEGQNNQGIEKPKTGEVKGKTSSRNTEQKAGSNILDIERLKQLPKLF
ncbi:SCL-interrupting locus protein homolog isoform X1 [Patiria miniata]|uniref:STIL N-terminal domain-containing protein n=1 Tax=Patiria miniata TaxID=46514 RepID=A0A913ZBS8_PATMI|nr:SCL-interrupting locus protein homolog isoform X1 [Patiria miniata]XP_038048501.1 SCL-interrupting locus protein homolog isoform X1 [Patiria miniata]